MIQGCFKGILRMFQGFFKGVSRVFQVCFIGVSQGLSRVVKGFKGLSREFHG